MAFTDEEKVNARHHMGYLNVSAAQTYVFGVPAGVQTQFQIEGAFDKVLPAAIGKFRNILQKLDMVENQIEEDMELLAVTQIGEITIRPDEFKQLVKYYQWWQGALGNLMGIPPNAYDQRFTSWLGGGSSGGVNVPVNH